MPSLICFSTGLKRDLVMLRKMLFTLCVLSSGAWVFHQLDRSTTLSDRELDQNSGQQWIGYTCENIGSVNCRNSRPAGSALRHSSECAGTVNGSIASECERDNSFTKGYCASVTYYTTCDEDTEPCGELFSGNCTGGAFVRKVDEPYAECGTVGGCT